MLTNEQIEAIAQKAGLGRAVMTAPSGKVEMWPQQFRQHVLGCIKLWVRTYEQEGQS